MNGSVAIMYTNSVIQVYKFKKIAQVNALHLSCIFQQIVTLLLSYLNGESEKQTHLCRTVELSERLSD
jgi:hypothetical protein